MRQGPPGYVITVRLLRYYIFIQSEASNTEKGTNGIRDDRIHFIHVRIYTYFVGYAVLWLSAVVVGGRLEDNKIL